MPALPPCPVPGPPPGGLYIHLPFCRSKCSYCAFTSYPCQGEPPAGYLQALQQQLVQLASHPLVRELSFASIYLGGGTPTIFPAAGLAELLATAFEHLRFTNQVEITVETNPNTVTPAKLHTLQRAGINRLSIGIQSFSDRVLTASGRSHTAAEARQAIDLARQAGFSNLSLDLIYGLPAQTRAAWQESLEESLRAKPEHLSLYELMIEEGTPFAERARQGTLALPAEEEVIEMEALAYRRLAAQGLERYEIANFARPGRECRHNLNYWRNGSYVGLGAGAVSYLEGIRLHNVTDPALYEQLVLAGRPPYEEAEILPPAGRFRETVIMGLRLLAGISPAELKERFGWTPQEYYGPTLDRLLAQGLLTYEQERLRLTARGLPVANQVLAQLV